MGYTYNDKKGFSLTDNVSMVSLSASYNVQQRGEYMTLGPSSGRGDFFFEILTTQI